MAIRRTPVIIVFFTPSGQTQQAQGTIKDLFSRYKADFLQLKDGTEIRLDRILQLNGKRPNAYD